MSLAVSSVRSPAGEVATDAAAVARTRRASWLVLLPLAAALAVFAPVCSNPLGYDDLMHLYNLVNFGVLELTMTPHAGHLLFFSNLMYVPLWALFGAEPMAYSVVCLVTHLVNVVLCYALLLRLTARPFAAALATSLWGCAAFHTASVGAFAVYGQLVAAILLLVLLHCLVDGRPARPTRALVVETLLLVAVAGSFGYGLLVAALWPAIRAYAADESVTWRGIVLRLLVSAAAVVVLYAGVGLLHDAISDRPPFGSGQLRIRLGQASANDALLFVYATLERLGYGLANTFVVPTSSLLAVPRVTPRLLGAWLGTVQPRDAFLAFRVASVVWLATVLFWRRHRPPFVPRLPLGVGGLALGCYATVALTRDVGWAFNFFFVPMLLAGRYQYVPTLALTVATVTVLPSVAHRSRALRSALLGAALAWTTLVVGLDWMTVRDPAPVWNWQALAQHWLTQTVRKFPTGSVVYVDNGDVIPLARHDPTLPGSAGIASIYFLNGVVDGRRVRFVEHDPALVDQIRRRPDTPIARLVVAPDEVPPDAQYVRKPGAAPPPTR